MYAVPVLYVPILMITHGAAFLLMARAFLKHGAARPVDIAEAA
jgi:hypothetical protein